LQIVYQDRNEHGQWIRNRTEKMRYPEISD
jgi:hypothetical protein